MKNNWLKLVNRINSDKYVIPAGWDTREQVAKELQCDTDRVNDLLREGISAGLIERKEFPVWDHARRLTTRVVCYRETPTVNGEKKPADTAKTPAQKPVVCDSLEAKIRRSIVAHPDWSDYRIAKNHRGATSAMVKRLRGL